MPSYDEILNKAWKNLLNNYDNNIVDFENESTLKSHLFAECLRIMKEESFETPFKIYAEKSLLSGPIPIERLSDALGSPVDLVLGDNEIAVELKLAPKIGEPLTPSTVKKDLHKLSKHVSWCKVAYFLAIDLKYKGYRQSPIETALRSEGITTPGEERHTRDGYKYVVFLIRKTKSK